MGHLLGNDLDEKPRARGKAVAKSSGGGVRTIREGNAVKIFTVGYERRDGDELMAVLRDHGVTALADIRERPMSRKPDFRAGALRALCAAAGIDYQGWPMLGSTAEQREQLQATGDFAAFERQFRTHAKRTMAADLKRLSKSVKGNTTALLCYERRHEECHRSVIADLAAETNGATIMAID